MVRTSIALLAVAIFALPASAQVVRTNDIMSLNPAANPVTATVGDTLRYTVYARKPSGAAYDLTGLFGRHIIHESRPDFDQETTGTVSIIDATNGCARVMKTFGDAVEGWHRIDMFQANNSNVAATIAWDDLSITNATTPAGGGDCNVSVTATTVVEVTDGPDTIGVNGIESNSFNFAVSGGLLGIESNLTTGTFTITSPNPYTAPTNEGVTYTWQSTGGAYTWAVIDGPSAPVGVAGTNYYVFTNYAAGMIQNFIVPPGVTSLHWFVQGAGGSQYGGNGAMTECVMPTLPGTIYDVGVGCPGSNGIGSAINSGTNFTEGGWFGGGRGAGYYGGGGGGMSFVKEHSDALTNLEEYIAIGPGGPGGYSQNAALMAANAGGWVAYGAQGISPGVSNAWIGVSPYADDVYGNNAQPGSNSFTSTYPIVTNTIGTWLQAGNAVLHLVNSNASAACGGGGGYIGGVAGAGGVSNATSFQVSGTGGLPYVNTNFAWWGYSTRSSTNEVGGVYLPSYVPGRGMRTQPGYVTVKY